MDVKTCFVEDVGRFYIMRNGFGGYRQGGTGSVVS
jgi:hypothetical protein